MKAIWKSDKVEKLHVGKVCGKVVLWLNGKFLLCEPKVALALYQVGVSPCREFWSRDQIIGVKRSCYEFFVMEYGFSYVIKYVDQVEKSEWIWTCDQNCLRI